MNWKLPYFLKRTLKKFLSSSDAKWHKVLPFAWYCFNATLTSDDVESPFFLIHGRDLLKGCARLFGSGDGRDLLKGCARLFCSGDIRYIGTDKGLILFAKLYKLWLTHAKSLQENRLLKTNALECNKHFKSHEFKVGQLIAVKNHLKICLTQSSFQSIG